MKTARTIFSWALFWILFPVITLGQTNPPALPANLSLTPPATDMSVSFLAEIFGVVDGVLHGPSQLLGSMFGVFNAAVLALGTILAAYITFVSTLNTAHDGEVLGRKWSSIWIPVRMILGVGLILPKASGYSFIQIFVMWVVVQGIGAADSIWDNALGYLMRGGVIVQKNINPGTVVNMTTMNNVSGQMMSSLVCMYGLEQFLQQQRQDRLKRNLPDPGVVPSFTASISDAVGAQPNANGLYIMSFPNLVGSQYTPFYQTFNGACGSASWAAPDPSKFQTSGIPIDAVKNAVEQIKNSRAAAVQQMILDLSTPASTIVMNYLSASPLPLGVIQTQGSPPYQNIVWVAPAGSNSPPLMQGSELQNAIADYVSIMFPTLRALGNTLQGSAQIEFVNKLHQPGWIMAGQYCFDLVNLNQTNAALTSDVPPATAGPKQLAPSNNASDNPALANLDNGYRSQLNDLVFGPTTNLPQYITNAQSYPSTYQYQRNAQANASFLPAGVSTTLDVAGVLATVISPVVGTGLNIIISGINSLNTNIASGNPIVALAGFGSTILSAVIVMWIIGAIYTAAVTTVVSVGSCMNPLPFAVLAFLSWFTPLYTMVLGLLFVVGIGFEVFLPFIPYIIFTFGAIGWFIGVIEAMVAAPIVGLAIATPEGHEAMGKSVNGFMLLLGVFLRPSLMLFGYMAAIILSYVGVWLFNQGFYYVVSSFYTVQLVGITVLFWMAGIVAIYFMVILAIINRSFTLIYVIPDKVLRWVGGQHESLGEQVSGGVTQEVRGGFMGGAERAGGAVTGGFGKAEQTAISRHEQLAMQKESKDREMSVSGDEGKKPGAPSPEGGPGVQLGDKKPGGQPPGGQGPGGGGVQGGGGNPPV